MQGNNRRASVGMLGRPRRRYRELLREEIGRIVGDPAEIDAEIQALFIALG